MIFNREILNTISIFFKTFYYIINQKVFLFKSQKTLISKKTFKISWIKKPFNWFLQILNGWSQSPSSEALFLAIGLDPKIVQQNSQKPQSDQKSNTLKCDKRQVLSFLISLSNKISFFLRVFIPFTPHDNAWESLALSRPSIQYIAPKSPSQLDYLPMNYNQTVNYPINFDSLEKHANFYGDLSQQTSFIQEWILIRKTYVKW